MNLAASAIVLRPRTFGEILDLACRVSMSLAFGLYARVGLVVLLPIFAGSLALRYAVGWSWPAVWAVAAALGSVAQGAFTVAIGRLLFADSISAREVLRVFLGRAGAYAGAMLLSRLLLLASCLPALLGVPFAWPRVFFVHEASLLEGAGPVDALRRSSRFVEHRAVGVLGAILALLLIQVSFIGVVELLCQGLVADLLQLGKPLGDLRTDGGSPFALAGFLVSFPYVATVRFLQYVDARTRADGWDIQLRFMAIAIAEEEHKAAA